MRMKRLRQHFTEHRYLNRVGAIERCPAGKFTSGTREDRLSILGDSGRV